MAKVNVRRKLLVGSFLLPALILIVLIFVRSRHITTPPSSIPSVTAFSSTYAEWAAQIYTPISNGKEFRSKVESLPIEHTCDLSPLEEAGIRKAVSNFLMAFHSDSYEDYRAFRTPVPAQFNMSRIAAERKFCKEDWKNANHKVPDDPEGIFKRFWEVQYLNKYVPNPAKIKDSTIGQALMTGIAFKATDTKIGVEEVSDSLPNLKTYLDSHRHAGATLYPSSFVFEHTPESILKVKNKLKIATVECLIQYAKPEPPSPACVRFYWDDDNQVWLPYELGLAVPGLTRTRDLVF